ncbi:hypothetical protein EBB07_01340 [Paenibacillaceae bacterium]|nr:hypothetical protein EBB07_01340 [Paenibacillaceae bacterium]
MNIKSITPQQHNIVTGRLSDGSDRKVETVTEYYIIVEYNGQRYFGILPFDDEQMIIAAFNNGQFALIPLTPEERIAQLEAELAVSKRENLTVMEAIADLYELILGAE